MTPWEKAFIIFSIPHTLLELTCTSVSLKIHTQVTSETLYHFVQEKKKEMSIISLLQKKP